MKSLFLAAAAVLLPWSLSAQETPYSFEACVYNGPCTIRVQNADTGDMVWLIKQDGIKLPAIFEGEGDWWIVDRETYISVVQTIPDQNRFEVPAVNPNTGATLAEKGGQSGSKGSKGGSSGGTSGSPGGGLVTVEGSFNVNVGGSSSCADCHKGSLAEIHGQKLGNPDTATK